MQITEILNTLGYDRVLKGSRAFKNPMVGWDSCFLALAYGEEWELSIAFDSSNHYDMATFVARRLGLSVSAVETIVYAFDEKPVWLQQIVTRWLLANDPVNQNRVPQCSPSTTLSGTTTQEVPSPKSPAALAHDSITEKVVEWQDIPMAISSSSLPNVPST